MFAFCLNKSGFRIILILQLLCLSLCPTYGRPSFDEGDTLPYEDHDEPDEHQVDDEDDSEGEDDNEDENDGTQAPKTTGLEKCLSKPAAEKKTCLAVEALSAAASVATGSSPQELVANKLTKLIPGQKDEYDD